MLNRLKLVDLLTDYLLVCFLISIFAITFLGTLSFSPVGSNLQASVLGIDSDQLKFSVDQKFDSRLALEILKVNEREVRLKVSTLSINKGQFDRYLYTATNNSDVVKDMKISLISAQQFLPGVKYAFVVNGEHEYVWYDDASEQVLKDFIVTVKPGQSVSIDMRINAYKNIAFPVDLVVVTEVLGAASLP